MTGLIHIYTGNGKGKTTAAIGLGVRAWGRGIKVLLVQFLKGQETGELTALAQLAPGFQIRRGKGVKKFVKDMNAEELAIARQSMAELLNEAQIALKEDYGLIILDEVMAAITTGLLPLNEMIALISNKPENVEIVMTGRNAPAELIELADYVSEINAIKHPYDKGIPARKGIEY